MAATVRIHGMNQLIGKLEPRLIAQPARNFLNRGALLVEGTAKRTVAQDTHTLQRSITNELDSSYVPRWAVIGTNVPYGPYVEHGTRAHFPPVGALGGWARRHNTNPYAVARSIARKGTKAQPFLEPALTSNEGRIRALVPVMAAEIEGLAGSG